MNYYTTSGAMYFWEFIEIEVYERDNYTLAEVLQWRDKYGIKDETAVMWVSPEPSIALSYQPADEPTEIQSTEGFIIPESDDGNNGFLFILNGGIQDEIQTDGI